MTKAEELASIEQGIEEQRQRAALVRKYHELQDENALLREALRDFAIIRDENARLREALRELAILRDDTNKPRSVLCLVCHRRTETTTPDGTVARRPGETHADGCVLAKKRRRENSAALADIEILKAQVDRLRAVLLGYERWEADVILDSGAWPLTEACVLSQQALDGLLRLQAERNAALKQGQPA